MSLGRETIRRPQHRKLASPMGVHGQYRSGAPWSELALDGRGRLEVLKLGSVAKPGGGLCDYTAKGVLLFGPDVITGVNALPKVNTPLVRALVYPGLERVEDPVSSSGSDGPGSKVPRRIFAVGGAVPHHPACIEDRTSPRLWGHRSDNS